MTTATRFRIKFVLRDLWVGVYIAPDELDESSGDFVQRTYVCLIPCLPIIIERWGPGYGTLTHGAYSDA